MILLTGATGFLGMEVLALTGSARPPMEVLAERLEHVGDLEETIFIDDRLDNVQAAVLAGMDAVQFTGPDDLRADLLFRGLPLKEV